MQCVRKNQTNYQCVWLEQKKTEFL